MVNVLVSAGADLSAVDSNGNTLLHLLVHHELTDMYDHVVELWKAEHGSSKLAERDSEYVARLCCLCVAASVRDVHLWCLAGSCTAS